MRLPSPALVRLLQLVGEEGFRLTARGDRLSIVGPRNPPAALVAQVRAAKADLLALAPLLSWRCQVIIWPREVWSRYQGRVEEMARDGIDRLEAEQRAYPDFAAGNVVEVAWPAKL